MENKRVQNINDCTNRQAKTILAELQAEPENSYITNILMGAAKLVGNGKGHFTYCTSWISGSTRWEDRPNGECVIVTSQGEII